MRISPRTWAGGIFLREGRPSRSPVLYYYYCFEDINSELIFDFYESEHDEGLLYVLNFITEQSIDFAQAKLVPWDESIAVIEEDAVEKIKGVGLPV
jgi:hypothetical protein